MYTSRLGNDGHEAADVAGDLGDWISHLSVKLQDLQLLSG